MALAIAGVRVWDGHAETPSDQPMTVRVEDGRIAAVGTEAALARDAEVVRLPGATALPGLIDAHVHVSLNPGIGPPRRQLELPREQLEREIEERCAAMVRAGITTARDLGGGAWAELDARNRIARGEIPGPRLLCAGQPVTTPGGHCHFWGGEAGGGDAMREVVRRQAERGAEWIKVMATGGVMTKGTRIDATQFDRDELEELVATARALGRPVAAHCHGTAGIRNAVDAGVRTVEHCSWADARGFGHDLDPELVARIAARDVWVSPTVNAGWRRRLRKDGEPSAFARRMAHCLRAVRDAGGRLIASTDAGIPGVEHHRLPEALAVMAELADLSPAEALRSATSASAEALGIERETGALRAGLAADVLVVDGNPLADLAALARPLLVIARGRRIDPARA